MYCCVIRVPVVSCPPMPPTPAHTYELTLILKPPSSPTTLATTYTYTHPFYNLLHLHAPIKSHTYPFPPIFQSLPHPLHPHQPTLTHSPPFSRPSSPLSNYTYPFPSILNPSLPTPAHTCSLQLILNPLPPHQSTLTHSHPFSTPFPHTSPH